jgi:hypothetical protein
MSDRVYLQTEDLEEAKAYFQGTGMTVVEETADSVELVGEDVRLFIDRGPKLGPIMELLVPELEMARDDLVSQDWTVVRWEGKAGRCYLSNSMGLLFNLSEDLSAFSDDEMD